MKFFLLSLYVALIVLPIGGRHGKAASIELYQSSYLHSSMTCRTLTTVRVEHTIFNNVRGKTNTECLKKLASSRLSTNG